MSHRYVPTRDSKRARDLKWANGIAYLHDLNCDCYHPLEHTATFIFEREKDLKFSAPEKQIIQQCLSGDTVIADTHTDGDAEDIADGTLEQLFAEPFGEDDTG